VLWVQILKELKNKMAVIGHCNQKNILFSMSKKENIPHAFIFSGPNKIGKKMIALDFAKNIFCQEKNLKGEPCDKCYACRSINESTFPDVTIIAPEDGSKEIKIEQIWQLSEKLSLKSYGNSYKIGIINDAHLMNVYAQNSLLKTLEEPKGKSIIILITAYPEMLISTIKSRAQNIKFSLLDKELIENHLISLGAKSEDAKEIAMMSSGQIGKAVDFFNNPDKVKNFNQSVKDIETLCFADYHKRFEYAKKMTDATETNEGLMEIMEIWERFFRREMLYKIFGNKDRLAKYSVNDLVLIIKDLSKVKHLIASTNINKKLAIENLLIKL
jgi:DNA polymerase-3 subunit delta'